VEHLRGLFCVHEGIIARLEKSLVCCGPGECVVRPENALCAQRTRRALGDQGEAGERPGRGRGETRAQRILHDLFLWRSIILIGVVK
jgi:hypothetical protein